MTSFGWSDLVSTALVGTSRRPVAPWSPELETLVPPDALAAPVTEGSLLGAVGAITLARRAGVAPLTGIAALAIAPADDRPLVTAAAAARLDQLLSANDQELLQLWLTLAADRGLRVPGRFLASMLHVGRLTTSLRPLISSVAGPRGAWLAAQRDDWRMFADVVPADVVLDESAWSEGTPGERVAYLTSVRRADPERARDLVRETWPQEAPAERAAFLGVLVDGLDRGDEEFCEAALTDRRKEVRDVAARLLAGLDGSAYQQRMAVRALACVSRSGRRLAVEPPAECDAAMKRDGIEAKPPAGVGARAWWLDQIVSATPLATWAALDDSPTDLVARKVIDEWAPTLHRAWGRAAVRSGDVAWALALLRGGFGRGKNVDILDAAVAADLHALLPPETALAWALEMLREKNPNPTDLSRLLDACPRPWPPKLATALLTHLRDQTLAAKSSYISPRLRELSRVITAGLPLDAAADVIALADKLRADHDDPAVTSVLATVVETVSVRYQMLMEFA